MKIGTLLWVGWTLLLLLLVMRFTEFSEYFVTGVEVGAALVLFGFYPAYLRGLERRVSALESAKHDG